MLFLGKLVQVQMLSGRYSLSHNCEIEINSVRWITITNSNIAKAYSPIVSCNMCVSLVLR